ncbi:MAG: hypothetical protein ACUVT2_11410 [Thiobacillaceae bacterium]
METTQDCIAEAIRKDGFAAFERLLDRIEEPCLTANPDPRVRAAFQAARIALGNRRDIDEERADRASCAARDASWEAGGSWRETLREEDDIASWAALAAANVAAAAADLVVAYNATERAAARAAYAVEAASARLKI